MTDFAAKYITDYIVNRANLACELFQDIINLGRNIDHATFARVRRIFMRIYNIIRNPIYRQNYNLGDLHINLQTKFVNLCEVVIEEDESFSERKEQELTIAQYYSLSFTIDNYCIGLNDLEYDITSKLNKVRTSPAIFPDSLTAADLFIENNFGSGINDKGIP